LAGRVLTILKENDGAKAGGSGAFFDCDLPLDIAALRTPLAGLCDLIWLNTARRMAHADSRTPIPHLEIGPMADMAPLVDTSAAKLQPFQAEPEAEISQAAPVANSLPDFDRTLHAATARLTGGLAPSALAGAYLDWMTHLAVAPGRQMQLAGQAAMGFLENLAFASTQHVKGAAIPTQKWVDQICDLLAAVVDLAQPVGKCRRSGRIYPNCAAALRRAA
jgi:Poly-beta-hydroxybutyrate polymerase N terminal